jgi:Cu(I)/Ag(I) efflux system membrane fusion protein
MGLPDTSPTPKKDPMGMDYIPVYAGEANGGRGGGRHEPDQDQHRQGSEARRQNRGRQPRSLERIVRAVGRIEPDERRQYAIAPKFEGYVERLLVNVTGQWVGKGQAAVRSLQPGTGLCATRIRDCRSGRRVAEQRRQ